MGHFLHIGWGDGGNESLAREIIDRAKAQGFAEAEDHEVAWLGVKGPRSPSVHFPGASDLLVLGDLFPAFGTTASPLLAKGSDEARALELTTARWGRYIGLLRTPRQQVRQIIRDPSGAYECIAWRKDGVQIVASSLPDWLVSLAAPTLALDWSRIGGILADPLNATADTALIGLVAARPGDMTDLNASRVTPLWRPGQFIGSGTRDPQEAAAGLRQRIDGCLACFSGALAFPGAEVSGGLDSAIVASALAASGAEGLLWLNFFGPHDEADERLYASAIGDRLGFQPTFVQRVITPMTIGGFWETAGGARPGLNGRDYAFDQAVAQAAASAGVDSLLTGKGGDGVFFQMGVADIFADVLKERGLHALAGPTLPNLARWTRRSIWSVLDTGLKGLRPAPLDRSARALSIFNPESVSRPKGDAALHPWIRDLETVSPAKRLQVESVAAGLAYQTQCRRTEVADLIHPLLAQPVVEYCLGLPIGLMTGDGRGDRQVARAAFADRLPPQILTRRSKGELTAYFGRQAAASLPFLRDHLLGGRLAEKGLIDKGRTEALLNADRLMWKGGVPDFTLASVTESWIQRWESRGAV